MKHLKGIIATSHIDSQNERMTFAALESMVEQINTQRIPMGIEHDPRIPPQGRAVSAQLEELELLFQFVIRDADRTLSIETILSNPGDQDIEVFLEQGLKGLDETVPAYLKDNVHFKKLVLEYADGKLKALFGVRKDAVPIYFEEHKPLK